MVFLRDLGAEEKDDLASRWQMGVSDLRVTKTPLSPNVHGTGVTQQPGVSPAPNSRVNIPKLQIQHPQTPVLTPPSPSASIQDLFVSR